MLKKTCSACGKDRKRAKLVYDESFRAYCLKSHECNENHPNSTTNLIRNSKQAVLFDYDNAVKRFASENTGETVRLLDAPITIRLTSIEQAHFIEQQCKERGQSTSEFIRSLIDNAVNNLPAIEVIKVSEKGDKESDEGDGLTF
ncbi:hypothetical protein UFOVP451_36 [uncultured Caudovirales phage]|uniref:Uncharacterized protein n=1 Tax=uncultured Caudovirales phage TaxID=2100421 RepID=A0A6J5MCD3_9CAUD|nr:hypothetical protein UFOVP451_36 [uncultured Caudovirales phage]